MASIAKARPSTSATASSPRADDLGSADFFQLISDTRHYWTDQMRAAIAGGKVSAVISDSPIQLMPLVLVPDDFLSSNGFRPTLTTDHFTLWTRTPARSEAERKCLILCRETFNCAARGFIAP